MILLEYNVKQGFHNNYIISDEGKFSSPLFAHGWLPVCIVPDSLKNNPEFEVLTSSLEEMTATYEDVVSKVTFWVMNELNSLEGK